MSFDELRQLVEDWAVAEDESLKTFEACREARLDYQIGRMSAADYQELRLKRTEAVKAAVEARRKLRAYTGRTE